MSIPNFQQLMLPLLTLAEDGQEHSKSEVVEKLARQFNLTDEERRQLRPSGGTRIFDNRVAWATTYMKKAGLLEATRRAYFKVTPRGLKVLASRPARIDRDLLMQFSEFVEFATSRRERDDSTATINPSEVVVETTPEDAIELGYQRIREELESDLLDQVKACSPEFFEQLVVQLLVKMGYGGSLQDAGQAIGKSGDGGVDGIIKEDKLGLDVIYIQAKRWADGTVGRVEIQKFVGALHGFRARKGVFITTSGFTKDAIEYVSKIESKIVLIDGPQLATLMVDHNLGISTVSVYEIKRMDTDFFLEG